MTRKLLHLAMMLAGIAAGWWILAHAAGVRPTADAGRPPWLAPPPPGALPDSLPDFGRISDPELRKRSFFAFLLPVVEQENRRLLGLRRRLLNIRELDSYGLAPDPQDQEWLLALAEEYEIPAETFGTERFWELAMRRVDVVPAQLVLVQAANESAWGTSRFAREGNNLFGMWCTRPGCGMVPAERTVGARHEVARFGSIAEAVGRYMHNLNTGRTYLTLREIREGQRRADAPLDADRLADGLVHYSERGRDYVVDLQSMLRQNSAVIEELRRVRSGSRPS